MRPEPRQARWRVPRVRAPGTWTAGGPSWCLQFPLPFVRVRLFGVSVWKGAVAGTGMRVSSRREAVPARVRGLGTPGGWLSVAMAVFLAGLVPRRGSCGRLRALYVLIGERGVKISVNRIVAFFKKTIFRCKGGVGKLL
uniref:Uncharacterized protein n=1 Tax=Molossus molossus TaxID=27622 RepID=A0A7J8BKH5_MOLMO|nr:hypothetical protein HJG59_010215 [Molossus molossus]